jgi:hypothetical protein
LDTKQFREATRPTSSGNKTLLGEPHFHGMMFVELTDDEERMLRNIALV